GSGRAMMGGGVLRLAADARSDKAKSIAGLLLEANVQVLEFRDGVFRISGTDRMISFPDVAKAAYHPGKLPKELRAGLEASAFFAAEPPAFPNGCHVCEVEIDPDTGQVTVDRYTAVDDFGKLINPLIVAGQVHGALAQGLEQALGEEVVHDEGGQRLTGSFMDYQLPRADGIPAFTLAFNGEPCRTNPLGVKGAGE